MVETTSAQPEVAAVATADAPAAAAPAVHHHDVTCFQSAQELAQVLETDHMELLTRACKQLKDHLRLLFKPDHPKHIAAQRVIIEYIDEHPDLRHIWSAFDWSKSHRPLQSVILDVIGLFLSVPIPLPTHRAPLFRHLLKAHSRFLEDQLKTSSHPLTTIATLRTLTMGVRDGHALELINAELLQPYPQLAKPFVARANAKNGGKAPAAAADGEQPAAADGEDEVEAEGKGRGAKRARTENATPHTTVRSAYMQFIAALLSSETPVRKRILETRDYVGPLTRDLEADAPDAVSDLLDALLSAADDLKLPRTTKMHFFNQYMLDVFRKLYLAPAHRDAVHAFLVRLCTTPGAGVCFRDRGLYPSTAGAHRLFNPLLALVATKLDITDALQRELLFGIFAASPELVGHYTKTVAMSLDPRPSARWVANVNLVCDLVAAPLPKLLDPSHAAASAVSGSDDTDLGAQTAASSSSSNDVYLLDPPPLAHILAHVAPSPPITRANLARGLSLASPVVLFFTLRLAVAVLEKYGQADAALAAAAAWWSDRDADAAAKWAAAREELANHVARLLPDFASIQKVLFNAQGRLAAGVYDLDTVTDPAARALEEAEGVQPAMVYLCAVRAIKLHAELLPRWTPAFDTSKLLAPLPPPELCAELLALLRVVPPTLAPKSLATLLRLHATGEFADQSTPLLVKLLAASNVFAACAAEPQWWLADFPASMDVIVFVTNLFGFATQRVYAMLDLIGASLDQDATAEDADAEADLPFSPMVAALVAQLAQANAADGAEPIPDAAKAYAKAVLARILAAQVAPGPLTRLLTAQAVDLAALPGDVSGTQNNPVLRVTRCLQSLAADGDDAAATFRALTAILDDAADDRAALAKLLAVILKHPQLAPVVRAHPEPAAEFVAQHLAPAELRATEALREPVAAVLAEFKAALTASSPKMAHCRAAAAVYSALGAPLDLAELPTSALSAAQWLTLLPCLAQVPQPVADHLFTAADVSEHRIELMLHVLQAAYPVRGSCSDAVLRAAEVVPLDLARIPASCLTSVLALRPATPSSQVLVTILATYSARLYEVLLAYLEAAKDAQLVADYIEPLVNASVTVGPAPAFALEWLDGVPADRVLALACRVPALVKSPNLRVALVASEAVGGAAAAPKDVAPSLPSIVLAARAAGDDPERVAVFMQAVAALLTRRVATIPERAAVLEFVASAVPSVDDAAVVLDKPTEFIDALLATRETAALDVVLAWAPQIARNQSSGVISAVLDAIFAALNAAEGEEGISGDTQVRLLCAAHRIMATDPARLCKHDYMLQLVAHYKATLHPRDATILAIFQLYELRAGTHLGQHLLFWGQPPSTLVRTVEDSIDLIDADKMARSMRYLPLDLDLQPALDAVPEVPAAPIGEDRDYLYDPRFFLAMALKYLEQGNTIDIRLLLERHLVGLAIAALASAHPAMRRAALAVLDEFSTLIDTSRIKGKASIILVLDLLRHQITSRDPTDPTRLPCITATYVALATGLLLHPEHDAYEPVHAALLARPYLDLEGIPAFLDLMPRAGRERGWMLMLLQATLRTAADAKTFLDRHVFDWMQSLGSAPAGVPPHHARGMLHVVLNACVLTRSADAEMAGTLERSVFATGVLPYLHRVAETLVPAAATATNEAGTTKGASATAQPALLVAIARTMAVLATHTDVQKAHAALIAQTCLTSVDLLDIAPARDPALWLAILDAVTAVAAAAPRVQATVRRVLASLETATECAGWIALAATAKPEPGFEARVLGAPAGQLAFTLERVETKDEQLAAAVLVLGTRSKARGNQLQFHALKKQHPCDDAAQYSVRKIHDAWLPGMPTAVEWFNRAPGTLAAAPPLFNPPPGATGNFLAVAGQRFDIELWNADIVGPMLPVAYLGSAPRRNRGSKFNPPTMFGPKATPNGEYHVMCVAALSWHPSHPKLLASGSQDSTVKVWDLDALRSTASFIPHPQQPASHRGSEVTLTKWSPLTPACLLTGSSDRTVRYLDTRLSPKSAAESALRFDLSPDPTAAIPTGMAFPRSAVFAPSDQQRVFVSTAGGDIVVLDLRNPAATLGRGHLGQKRL
ncbi:hypothetical protein H9P43_006115 [Blastocladiella emersonii ATCC 22665]|nr:hypothetical protein H9P43_006115 [Blastocladiella emersonii ATCC 22665]